MLNKISNLDGVKTLKKEQQIKVNAGSFNLECTTDADCGPGSSCIGCFCLRDGDHV